MLAAVIGIFKYGFIANSIDIHYLNKTFSLEKLIVLSHHFPVFACCCFAKHICPSQRHLFPAYWDHVVSEMLLCCFQSQEIKKITADYHEENKDEVACSMLLVGCCCLWAREG